jgi:hypothetical protein
MIYFTNILLHKQGQSDIEWKFSRSKLWLSCFEETPTLPSPYNVYPTLKQFKKLFCFLLETPKIIPWSQVIFCFYDNIITTTV